MATFRHLGEYSDWVEAARARRELYPLAPPGAATQDRAREILSFSTDDESPREVQTGERWERDGVVGEAVSWSVGYGPRTAGWVLKPTGATGPLPAVLALHDHGGFKFYGKEKIADGPADPHTFVTAFRDRAYGGRAFANALAREGFVVLVHDTFLWGSRRFPLAGMPNQIRNLVAASRSLWAPADPAAEEIAEYNAAAGHHEHLVEKYCNLLGTTLAGMVAYEDRVAVNYLRSRPDVQTDRIACAGLSGGGNRATLLVASCDQLAAAAIVGLMSTYEGLLDHNVMSHTWMFFPNGWARHGDWPDLAAARAPMPLLVQYDLDDDLFTPEGMHAADARLAAHYRTANAPDAYTGEFYPGPHKFDLEMQEKAFGWLVRHLAR